MISFCFMFRGEKSTLTYSYISLQRGMVYAACSCVSLNVLTIYGTCVCQCMCARGLSVSGGVRQGGEPLMTHTECRQLCSRCTLQSHVWIPFVVFLNGGHQDLSHPPPQTSGLVDLSAQLLINRSDDRRLLSKKHSKKEGEPQMECHTVWKADL